MNCALMQNVVLFVGIMVKIIKGISFKAELSGFNGMNCQALQLELCIKELERNFFKFYKNLTRQKVVFHEIFIKLLCIFQSPQRTRRYLKAYKLAAVSM